MNRNSKISLLLTVVVFFALSIFVLESNAQCVTCTPAPPGWMCMGTSMPAGQGCITEGLSCTVIGTCTPENNLVGSQNTGKCSLKTLDDPYIDISDSIIRDVAEYDARIALALINIRNIKAEFEVGKVSFIPVEVNGQDVENQLTLPQTSDYFRKLNEQIKQNFAGKTEPIVYDFVITRNDDKNPVLQISPANSKVLRSSVEINLSKMPEQLLENNSPRFEALSWKNK